MQVRKNKKDSGILGVCRPPWLVEEENFSFQVV